MKAIEYGNSDANMSIRFALLGIVVPVSFVGFRGSFQTGTGIGIFITMIVFIGYGFALWVINRFLKKHLGCKRNFGHSIGLFIGM